jgi:hypothetical protein
MPQKLKRSKSQQAILDREIRDEMLKLIDKYNNEYDICIASALNECSGFGRKRIKRLFKQIIANRLELRRFYSDDNNSDSKIDIFVMEKRLERKGINLTEIFDEIMKEMFDEVNELNAHNKRKG